MKSSRKKGFTLLEVLVVLALIIIIAGIAFPRLLDVLDQAKETVAKGDLRVLQTAIDSYLLNTNSIPDPSEIGSALEGAKPTIITDYDTFKDPFAPSTNDPHYHYVISISLDGLKKYYVFWSIGKDGSSNITGIDSDGVISFTGDDIYVTNGKTSSGVGP